MLRLHSARLLVQLGRRAGAPAALVACLSSSAGDAAEIAKQLSANQLHEELESLRATTSALPHSQLLQFAQSTQGLTPAAAEDVIGRLERSGQLLNLAGTVVLRPGDVARALNLVLPSSSSHTEQRLAEVQQELAALDAQQAAVGRRSRWRRHGFIWAGLSSQVLLWGLLFRLTFYELSWDVMEPICFFVSGVQALACYSYFMVHKREFTWDSALDRYVGRWEAEALRRAGFDTPRYAYLQRESRRLDELAAAQRQREAEVAEAAEAAEQAAAEEKKEA